MLVVLPSYSVSESLLSHYGDRIPSLEHRYLGAISDPGSRPVMRDRGTSRPAVPSRPPSTTTPALLPPDRRAGVEGQTQDHAKWNDGTPRSVAARLVHRPDLIAELRATIGGRPALHRTVERDRA